MSYNLNHRLQGSITTAAGEAQDNFTVDQEHRTSKLVSVSPDTSTTNYTVCIYDEDAGMMLYTRTNITGNYAEQINIPFNTGAYSVRVSAATADEAFKYMIISQYRT